MKSNKFASIILRILQTGKWSSKREWSIPYQSPVKTHRILSFPGTACGKSAGVDMWHVQSVHHLAMPLLRGRKQSSSCLERKTEAQAEYDGLQPFLKCL